MRAEEWETRHRYGHSSVNVRNIVRSLITLRSLTLSDSAEKVNASKIIQATRKVERQTERERWHTGNKLG